MTYYQLNCLLIENFNNSEFFTKQSKLEHITEYKPVPLGLSSMKDVENKLRLLEIVRWKSCVDSLKTKNQCFIN